MHGTSGLSGSAPAALIVLLLLAFALQDCGSSQGIPGGGWVDRGMWALPRPPVGGAWDGRMGPGWLRLRGGAVDAFSPWSNQAYVEMNEMLENDPEWYPSEDDVQKEHDRMEEEEAQGGSDDGDGMVEHHACADRMADDEQEGPDGPDGGRDAPGGGGKRVRKYEGPPRPPKTSMANCINHADLPFKTPEDVAREREEEEREEYIDDHEDEWSDECLWCSSRWSKRTKLLAAARDGDSEMVLSMLDEGAEINGEDVTHMGWTAMHYAAYYGHAQTLELLGDSGANINARDMMQWTPLHYAALKGRYDACLVLLNMGCDAGALTEKNKTALQKAAFLQHVDCIKLICEHTEEDPTPWIRVVPEGDRDLFTGAKRRMEETGVGEGKAAETQARDRERIAKAVGGGGSSGGESEEDVSRQARTYKDVKVDEPDIPSEAPERDSAEERNLIEMRAEYDRRYREVKNMDGRYGN